VLRIVRTLRNFVERFKTFPLRKRGVYIDNRMNPIVIVLAILMQENFQPFNVVLFARAVIFKVCKVLGISII